MSEPPDVDDDISDLLAEFTEVIDNICVQLQQLETKLAKIGNGTGSEQAAAE